MEDGRESSRLGPVRGDFIMASRSRRVAVEVSFLPGQGYSAVAFDPGRLEVRNDLQDGLADDVSGAEPGQPLEGGIYCQEPVVARLAAIIENDLVNAQAVQHLAEEDTVILLGGEEEAPLFLCRFFGPFAFADVGIGSEPLKDTSVAIFERHDPRQEGTEDAVGSAQREFHVKGFAAGDRLPPAREHRRKHLRVVHALPAPAFHLGWRRPGVLVPPFVVPVDVTVGTGDPGELRNGVCHGPKALFALA